jgi:hypothetical protein
VYFGGGVPSPLSMTKQPTTPLQLPGTFSNKTGLRGACDLEFLNDVLLQGAATLASGAFLMGERQGLECPEAHPKIDRGCNV